MYVIYGPYILAAFIVAVAIIMGHRDIASTTQVRITLGTVGAAVLLWTGLLLALSKSDL